jgi:hypothetical protein
MTSECAQYLSEKKHISLCKTLIGDVRLEKIAQTIKYKFYHRRKRTACTKI